MHIRVWKTIDNKTLRVTLKNYKALGGTVTIDNGIISDGIYYLQYGQKFIIKNGIVEEVFYVTKYKNLTVEQVKEHIASIGDQVFINNNVAADGKYKTGFMAGKICVENGSISKFE